MSTRPDFVAIQNEFAKALLSKGDTLLVRGGKLSAEKRIEIYRHNVFSTLAGALSDLYPVTEKIVGAPFFFRLAEEFIRATPSRSGDLNMFGGEWPEFLRVHADAIHLPYLPDVAQLEWAWHRAFHAADHAAFDISRLGLVPPEQHALLRFVLNSSATFILSPHPIARIWKVNQTEFEGDMKVDWTKPGDLVLIARDDLEIKIQSLSRAHFDFLRALNRGESLEASADVASDVASMADAEFDLQAALMAAIQSNLIVDMKLPEPSITSKGSS